MKTFTIVLLTTSLLFTPNTLKPEGICLEKVKTVRKEKTSFIKVNVSVYNATVKQCDSTPLLTASGSIIDTNLLKQGKIKWCAISRNLKSKFKFNDIIVLQHEGSLSGKYIVKDVMDERYFNKVDILHYDKKYCKTKGRILL